MLSRENPLARIFWYNRHVKSEIPYGVINWEHFVRDYVVDKTSYIPVITVKGRFVPDQPLDVEKVINIFLPWGQTPWQEVTRKRRKEKSKVPQIATEYNSGVLKFPK